MKHLLYCLLYTMLFTGLFFSCAEEPEIDLDAIALDTEVKRFDQAFYQTDSAHFNEALPNLKQNYAPFFSSGAEDIFWRNQRFDEQNQHLYQLSQKTFSDWPSWEEEINKLIKRYYYYFGVKDTIQAYAYISSLDFNYPVVFASPYLFVALDLYLGERGAEFYQSLPQYLQYHRQPAFLLRDIAYSMAQARVPAPPEPIQLIDAMVYHGKVLKLVEKLVPQLSDEQLLVYPPGKMQFAKVHEKNMWIYFIENQLLFKTDQDLQRRFIEVAPFSKFRTNTDPETPGRIGRWFGYRIVDAYLQENPGLKLSDLLKERDSRKILKLSGYKP